MISTLTFVVLVVIDAVFVLYTAIDNRNRIYANIATAAAAAFLSAYIGLSLINGNIGDTIPVLNTTTVLNASVVENVTTLYAHTTMTLPQIDPALGLLFIGISVIMGFAAFLLGVEAVKEKVEEEFE